MDRVRAAVSAHGRLPVVLTGGAFHHRRLAQGIAAKLADLEAYRHGEVPPGDGGIALGQPLSPMRWPGMADAEPACMCLGVPGRVVSIDGDIALVDFWGVTKSIRLDVVDEPVAPGDYVLNHVGFAIRRIPAEDVEETLALYDELVRRAAADDLMAADVRGELAAAPRRDEVRDG